MCLEEEAGEEIQKTMILAIRGLGTRVSGTKDFGFETKGTCDINNNYTPQRAMGSYSHLASTIYPPHLTDVGSKLSCTSALVVLLLLVVLQSRLCDLWVHPSRAGLVCNEQVARRG
jgi:hypothetical protein